MNRPDASTQQQLGRIARGGAINMVGAVVAAATNFVLVLVVARAVDQDTAGALFAATSAMMILIALAALGTDTGLARFLLRYEATGRHRDVEIAVRVSLAPVLAATLAIAGVVALAARPIADAIGLDVAGGPWMLRILALALPFASVNDFALAGTRAFGRMRVTVLVDKILRSVLQVSGMFVVGIAGGGPVPLMLAWVAPYVVSAVIAATMFVRLIERRRRAWPDAAPASAPHVVRREFWGYTWPRSIARICQIVVQRADIVIIAAVLGPDDAAVYTAATRFVVLGQFAVLAIQQVLQPRFSDLLAKDELATVRDIFKISTAWSMALAWPMYLAVACAAPLYLRMFGDDYDADGVATVVVMAIAMMVAIAAGPLDTLLLMAGGSTTSLVNAGIAMVVDIAGCFLLIPHLGISGAAIAWGAAVVVRNALAYRHVHATLRLSPASRAGAIVAVSSATFFAAPLLTISAFSELTVPRALVAGVLGIAGFAAVLWWARRPLELGALRALAGRGGRRTTAVPA